MNTTNEEELILTQSGVTLEDRNPIDLTHTSFMVGAIGHLQTLSVFPVLAGDSIDIQVEGIIRASVQRRPMLLDQKSDTYVFYIPHRQIWSNWVDFIKAGIDEGVTLGSDTTTAGLSCLGHYFDNGEAIPRAYSRGLMHIWNNYFRDPSTTTGDLAEKSLDYLTTLAGADIQTIYGPYCCNLPRLWNTGVLETIDDSDKKVTLTDTNTKFSLLDLQMQKARLESELKRDYYASQRYRDVIKNLWAMHVSYNVDDRPELLYHHECYLSGYDVEGTDTASLGSVIGRGISPIEFHMPYKLIPEHGMIWCLQLLRFPPVANYERHYLASKSEWSYLQASGDRDLIANQPPISININEVFAENANAVSLGKVPYAQWYREQPNFIHQDFQNYTGWPFYDATIATRENAIKIQSGAYDDVYTSTQLKHWQFNGKFIVNAKRFIPDARMSIMAGTR